jgi:hypothetical protein
MVNQTRLTQFAPAAMLTILLLNIFIFSPLNIYLTNTGQFTAPLASVLQTCLIPVLALLLVSYPLVRILSARYASRTAAVFAVLSILIWFQGNGLLWDYGILNGQGIIWNDLAWRGWIDSPLWIAALLVTVTYHAKIGPLIIKGAVFVFVLQLITGCYMGIQKRNLLSGQVNDDSLVTLARIFDFSPDKNILHIVVDGFQSDVFDELMKISAPDGGYPESFQGFRFYKETLGVFPYTIFAVPAFLSGNMYDNEVDKDTYVENVLRGQTIISAAKDAGFEIDVASGGDYIGNKYVNLPLDHRYNLDNIASAGAGLKDAALAMDLGLFRVLPHYLKPLVYNEQKWLLSKYVFSEAFYNFSYFSHTYFLNKFTQGMGVHRERPVYKYIHVMNTHNPMVVDAECRYNGNPVNMDRITLTQQSRCTMDTLARLFNRMQELRIYDNTLIIIHGDHGGWVPNYRQGPAIRFKSGHAAPEWMTALASPLLAIKKPGDNSPYRDTDVPASLLDIPATVADIMGWNTHFNSMSLEKLQPGAVRERYFRFYYWQRDAWEAEYPGPIQEFSVAGSHYETSWKSGRIFYPPQSEDVLQ